MDVLIVFIIIFTSEKNRVARSPLFLTDKSHISKSLSALFSRKMASNQTNRFQSLDSSVEEFIDGQENENTKKKTKGEGVWAEQRRPKLTSRKRRKIDSRTHMYLFMKASRVVLREEPLT